MPSQVTIEQTDQWTIHSIGNGLAYEIIHRPTQDSLFVQDEDASLWRADYDAMQEAYSNPSSVWHKKTWNQCLTAINFNHWPSIEK